MPTAARTRATKPVLTPMPIMAGVERPVEEDELLPPSAEEVVAGGAVSPVGSKKSVLVEVTVSVDGGREVMVTVEVIEVVSFAPTILGPVNIVQGVRRGESLQTLYWSERWFL